MLLFDAMDLDSSGFVDVEVPCRTPHALCGVPWRGMSCTGGVRCVACPGVGCSVVPPNQAQPDATSAGISSHAV